MAKPDGNSELSDPENSCSLSASRNIKSLDDLEKNLKNISSFVIENIVAQSSAHLIMVLSERLRIRILKSDLQASIVSLRI